MKGIYRAELEGNTIKFALVDGRIVEVPAAIALAAPELLEALELAAFALEGRREDDDPTLSAVRDAIAKARGER